MFEFVAAAAAALVAAQEPRMVSVYEVRHLVEHRLRDWQHEGLIVSHRLDLDDMNARLMLRLNLPGNRSVVHLFTEHEARMGGMRAADEWLREVRRGLQRVRSQHAAGPALDYLVFDEAAAVPHTVFRDMMVQANPGGALFFRDLTPEERATRRAEEALHAQQRAEAEAKARELFVRAAGLETMQELERGRAVPLLGSAGGQYELVKQASFCVRRPKDGARLCAVVPGVPLWDHLLGIKLLVEVDEPRFLRTANVSRQDEVYWAPPPWRNGDGWRGI